MYTHIYQNSYIVAIITFILLSVFCYFFEIGYSINYEDDKVVKKFSWKYPLAITLIIWVVWHFILFPPPEQLPQYQKINSNVSPEENFLLKKEKVVIPKFNSTNWY